VISNELQPIVYITIKVQPGAARNLVLGFSDNVLRVRVTAPPEGGKANQAVILLLANALNLAKGRINIVRGHTSRTKLVSVDSLILEEIRRRIGERSL
jgi:uncharacterized protein (TIGR00251 family)